MKNNIIDDLNKVLTNTLDYKEVLQKLADSISYEPTQKKLEELAEVAEEESKNLIQLISEMGGDIESTERQTDHESVCWVPRPLPDSKNMQAILAGLIKAERNKEDDYTTILGHENIKESHRSRLDKYRKEAEANLKYFKTAMESIEHKTQ